jgi:hypothetical protein
VKRREFIALFSGAAVLPLAVAAQAPPRIPRLGFLGAGAPPRLGATWTHYGKDSERWATWKGKQLRWRSAGPRGALSV